MRQLWRPVDQLYLLDEVEPVLESWDRRDHPDQLRSGTYVADAFRRVGPLPSGEPLYLSLRVDVKTPDRLLRDHDLENYVFPLFGTGAFRPAQFALVIGTKGVGGGPRDDRIVELHLHWNPDNSLGHDVQVGMWWREPIESTAIRRGATQ